MGRAGWRVAGIVLALMMAPAAWAGDPHAPISNDGAGLKARPQSAAATSAADFGLVERAYPGLLPDGAEAIGFSQALAAKRAEPSFAELLAKQGRSAPGMSRRTVIGKDDRRRVSNTRSFPGRAVVLITFSAGRCSGWLIGDDTVVTAGHCVYDRDWFPVSSYRIYPGRNGGASPYGGCAAKRLYTVAGWTGANRDNFDYGAIKLDCTVGQSTGWFGFFVPRGDLTGRKAAVQGYPGDKPLTQWRATGEVEASQGSRVFYSMDMVSGDSGAPVYGLGSSCEYCGFAINAYNTYGSGLYSEFNHGPRITAGVFNNLKRWKNAN